MTVPQSSAANAPLISVILPAYNAEAFLEATIRSVLGQSYPNWELLILDDGSSDGTVAIAGDFAAGDKRIILHCNESNMGVARTRNRGFGLAKGEFVALLDADDLWRPMKLEKQLARLQESKADFSYCSYGIIDRQGQPCKSDYLVPEVIDFDGLLRENVIGCSAVMLKREIVEQYSFHSDYAHEDYVLWLQLLQDGKRAVGVSEVLADWRYAENSRSFNKKKAAKNRWKIYRSYLKLPLHKSLLAFSHYAWKALCKYRSST